MDPQPPAAITEPRDKAAKPVKLRRISRRIREACDLIVSGSARTITEAARIANISREHLSRELSKPHVAELLRTKTCRALAMGIGRAGAVRLELLDHAQSEHVRNAVSTEVLALAGIAPPKDPQVSVNVGVEVRAGWVLDLRAPSEIAAGIPIAQPPTIDASVAGDE